MDREKVVKELKRDSDPWDFLIIGGGATGLGVAVDAAARGYRVILLEQHDFSKGTSSRSTKLIHGGVRYLKQGNITLVLEALKERGLLRENAPHLVRNQSFIVPIYNWWEGPFYGIGMKVYDRMAGKLGLRPSKLLSKEETMTRIPTLEEKGLKGGVIYYDGQFDDSRLAINLAQTVFDLGGFAINYMKVISLIKENEFINGAVVRDEESELTYEIRAKCVINATGVFSDGVRKMDDPKADSIIVTSQGVHLVLPKSFLPGDSAIMVPQTTDGRVLFAVPWHDHAIVGTTDTPIDNISLEPQPLDEEVDFILKNAAKYLNKDPARSDVLSVFAGLRPLVKTADVNDTATLSRDHTIIVSNSGLLTITGGKWTTYRKMAQDTIDQAEIVAGLNSRPCQTEHLQIHGWTKQNIKDKSLEVYGADAMAIKDLTTKNIDLNQLLSPDLPYLKVEVVWATRYEMARTVEDVLARRTRSLLLGAKASMKIAPMVARLMARELKRDKTWEKKTVENYLNVAQAYVLN